MKLWLDADADARRELRAQLGTTQPDLVALAFFAQPEAVPEKKPEQWRQELAATIKKPIPKEPLQIPPPAPPPAPDTPRAEAIFATRSTT